jgi:primosomal protein N' (replication factor Y)
VRVVRVALDVPLATLFDYYPPQDVEVHVGQRVLVPFGNGRKVGIVLETGAPPQIAPERIRTIVHVFTDESELEGDIIELLRFSANYYHYPIGQVAQVRRQARVSDYCVRSCV